MRDWLEEGFGDLGTTAESVIDSISQGTQGVIKGYADSKQQAYEGVIETTAISVLALILLPIVVWKVLE